ncbi:MAG: SPFH domain-containing protein [Eubacteriales bacterium]|nr:SPFH domain-containing protein [Eubacteriales bacterium]
MGLIKAIGGAIGGVFADQWKEYFYCDSLPETILIQKGKKRTSSRSSNTKGEDNIISNGSMIAVNDGQCMIIVEQGKVVELCAEPGEFKWDSSTEPSIFSGSLGSSILETFKAIGRRFTYGGDTGQDQRIYYFNTKEITGNKFGTKTPIPFRVIINEQLGYKLSIDLRCNGVYSYKIVNPILFYTNVAGNVTDCYERDQIDEMLRGELMNALQPALSKIAGAGVQYYELGAHSTDISAALNEELSALWRQRRGLEIFSFNVMSISVPDEQKKKITEWEENAMTINPATAAARLVGAQTDAMRTAAANEGGAMNGFVGMGMAMNVGGNNAQNLYTMAAQQQAQQQPQPAPATISGWTCACGQTGNAGKFCVSCGAKKPENTDGWICACGQRNKGKFCSECGAKKPEGVPTYRCDKCGWEPADPKNPPKFCPECGDRFDDADKR